MTIEEFAKRMNLSYDDAKLIVELNREEFVYCMEYHIIIDDIQSVDGININYWITVPGKSFQRSEDGIEMAGEYLASDFKEFITDKINKISKINHKDDEEYCDTNIECHYYIDNESEWTEESYNEIMVYILEKIAEDECFPLNLDKLKEGDS